MRRLLLAAAVLLGFVAAGCTTSPSNTGNASSPGEAVVQRVVDGDTIVVSIAGRDERVRLIGVDTPESVDPRTPVQCFGKEASNFTTQLLPPGTVVRLERDVEARDRFDRLLAYVYRVSDGLFVNFELVRAGYAQVLTIPPNVAYAEEFRVAAAAAREAGTGLWSACPDT
jgi:micrococcal nuclease